LQVVATRYRWSDFVLDLDGYRLERAGTVLVLEPKAFNLLVLMVQRPGHVFTKQEIFEALWPDTAVTDHALTRVVAQLRRVLGDDVRQARYLETVPTRGYRWIHPVDGPESPAPPARVPETDAVVVRRSFLPGLSAAAGLGLMALLMLAWAQRYAPAEAVDASAYRATADAVAWPVQMTTHGGLDFHPAFSPTGDGVAFVSDRSGALEVYVRGFGGAGIDTPLTSDGRHNVQPAWSPDGRTIAFHSYGRGGVWVMPARGGTPRQLVAIGSRPAWSPDGRRLAYQSDEHADASPSGFGAQVGSTLWLVDADGANSRPLTRSDAPIGGHSAPTWSADGRFIAFTVFDGGPNNGIWIVDVASGDTRKIHQGPGLYESVFAPDGSALFIAGGESYITRLPFDAATGTRRGEPSVIPVPSVPGVRGLTIAPDGSRIGFAGLALDSQIWKQPVGLDGSAAGPAVALTSDTSRRNSVPVISPDAARVAYVSTRRGAPPNVWMMDINGRAPLQLTADETPEHKPEWFRDGTRVAYVSRRNGSTSLWAVDVTTRREERLFEFAPNGAEPRVPGWLAELQLSPSMTRVALSVMSPPYGQRALYVSGTDRFAPRQISGDGVSAGYPAWSPDERFVAVEIKEGGSVQAGIYDVASGALRMLTRERGQTWVRGWSPDGSRVAAATLRDGIWSLRAIEVATGRQQTIHASGSPRVFVRYPEWSPRGDVIVFERGEMRANIWTLALGPAAAPMTR
jgi:Tol biopolymer transport system component/DNA-binding winged helix-turn-helix (wHTH) protein